MDLTGHDGAGHRDEGGFTLVEAIAAVFILSVAAIALVGAVGPSLRSLDTSSGRQDAIAAATAAIEELRGVDYAEIAMDSAAFAGGTFDPDGTAPDLDDETVATIAGGAVVDAAPFHHTSAEGVSIETTVTLWCRDPAATCDSVGDEDGRRITVVATWNGGGRQRTTRTSTLVAEAGRG